MCEQKVTICACTSRTLIVKNKISNIASSLREVGYEVNIVPDLCKAAISPASDMKQIALTTIMACYPRAIFSLFDTLDLKPEKIVDIRNGSASDILKELDIAQIPDSDTEKMELDFLPADTGQEAWFPVIDKKRCNNCGKCHDFCLFGVYSFANKEVKVQHPQNCKNNCPACARVCPQKAIIFPKYEKSPINGGLTDEEQFVKVDTKALYASALRMKLEERKAKGSILRKDI